MKKCHEIDVFVHGDDMQLVEIELDQNETVVAEGGAMVFCEDGIRFDTKLGDGSEASEGLFGKLLGAGKRMLTGETIFLTHFTNTQPVKRKVGFSGAHMGKVIDIDLNQFGQRITCQKEAFLCAAKGTEISIAFNKKFGSGYFGGDGFIMQSIVGDGRVILHAGGYISQRELNNQTLSVDTGCVVAFTSGIDMNIQAAGSGLKSMFLGGEGLFLATLQGTGTVWIQSMPISRLVDTISSRMPPPPSK
ncbi:TIGR00266 family protein [Vibrio sp. Makdt]|uniref:TIGR00266 family protein n=1 Tax=Vibrio sp. Makdt TaxID=2998828 RepID=UPI0022CD36A2|nr:TIGR00266 family protein [Vibrio sp. Makdt]MDA0152375.1 TIGR00266 family protein [Vibrio sp. Makdt]